MTNRRKYGDFKKVICKKTFVFPSGQGVAKHAEYYVKDCFLDNELENNFAVYKDNLTFSRDNFIGFIPRNFFMTLAEFRDLRIDQIFD